MADVDLLAGILARKRREIARRRSHLNLARLDDAPLSQPAARAERACAALRREVGGTCRAIAEIKMKSPGAGTIRERKPGLVAEIARAYEAAGAAAVSVLCDGPGFGGSPLDLRRASRAVSIPVLFKEFVLDRAQIWLARELGAHMVLLLARALPPPELGGLVDETARQGLAPLVEAADEQELEAALTTGAKIIGINARDLRNFRLDPQAAVRLVQKVPAERIAVYMSGISNRDDLARLSDSRADAVLLGEALMRAPSPGTRLRELLK